MTLDPYGEKFREVFTTELWKAVHCEGDESLDLAFDLGDALDACRELVLKIERFYEQIRSQAPLTELYTSGASIGVELGMHIPYHGKTVAKVMKKLTPLMRKECCQNGMSQDEFYEAHKQNVARDVKESSERRRRISAGDAAD